MSKRYFRAPTTDTRLFDGAPTTFDARTRSCDAILSTGSSVKRFYGTEKLRIDAKSIDLERIKRGQVALLDSHSQVSALTALGRVTGASIDRGALMGKIKFNETREGEKAMGMVQRGEVTGISIGYTVDDWEITDDKGRVVDPDHDKIRMDDDLLFTAVRWSLHEASLVSVPADSTATVRSIAANRSYRDMAVPASDEVKIRLAALERRMPESAREIRERMLIRQQMMESQYGIADESDEISDDEFLHFLRQLDDAGRWACLRALPDKEIMRLFGEMNDDD